jgi:hypothetical protein
MIPLAVCPKTADRERMAAGTLMKLVRDVKTFGAGMPGTPGSHIETGSVWARWLITVRDGCVVLEVSAFIVRHEPSAWLTVP